MSTETVVKPIIRDGLPQYLSPGYQVKSACNCRIVIGDVPISDFQMLLHGFSENAVMATDIAARIGATLVLGEPDDIEALRQLKLPVSDARIKDADSARNAGLPDGVVQWLLEGGRGRSSDAMCKAFYGIPNRASNDYPLDASDLHRCFLFLEAVGDRSSWRMDKLAEVSPQWAALVSAWDELEACSKGGSDTARWRRLDKRLREALEKANL